MDVEIFVLWAQNFSELLRWDGDYLTSLLLRRSTRT